MDKHLNPKTIHLTGSKNKKRKIQKSWWNENLFYCGTSYVHLKRLDSNVKPNLIKNILRMNIFAEENNSIKLYNNVNGNIVSKHKSVLLTRAKIVAPVNYGGT